MSRSKVSILSKYVMTIAILALLFSVSITSARYALNQSATIGVDIDSFDVDVSLYHDLGNGEREQVSGDINLDTNVESLSEYSEVYYLDITNGDNEELYYKIEEQSGNFCFQVGEDTRRYTTYGDSVTANSSVELTLTMSIRPDVLSELEDEENRSLSIKLYAEYQHSEEYISVEVEEPEPEPEDENHDSNEWYYLSNSNVSGASLDTTGNYCLIEDVELTDSMTISADITLCLNGHTITIASGYNPTQLISITSGSVTIEDCQGTGSINGGSLTQVISLSGSSTNLTLTTSSISGGEYNVAISNGATLYLEGATLTSGNTGSVNISNGTFNLVSGTLSGNSKTGVNVGANGTLNMTGGLITGASNGVVTTNGAKVNISGGSITNCTNAGINLVSGATLTLSGTPDISSNSSRNVYLESGALISLGELTSGANIGVTSAASISDSSSVQITSSETGTYYYENAIKYIHSDNSSYKVSINHASSGYLTLISTNYVNINVAIHYTNGTNYSNPIYFNGDSGAYLDNGPLTLSSYSGTYAYNTYVQYPNLWSINSDFNFVISANTDNMWYSGFAKNNNFTINWSDSNYNLWNTQYWWTSEQDNGNAVWGCTFSSLTTGIMSAIGDFVIVLELSSADISNSTSSTNNIVSNAYFIVDGVQQNLV